MTTPHDATRSPGFRLLSIASILHKHVYFWCRVVVELQPSGERLTLEVPQRVAASFVQLRRAIEQEMGRRVLWPNAEPTREWIDWQCEMAKAFDAGEREVTRP